MVVGLSISKDIASRGKSTLRTKILKIASSPDELESIKNKFCLVICNSYHGTSYDLGDPAINDGLLAYERFSKLGYETKVYYDIKKAEFMKVFSHYLKQKYDSVVVYYTGHGSYRHDTSGDEADHRDEMLVFRDGNVPDDDLHEIITQRQCKELLLFADCCHSGTIFDITSEEYKTGGIATISACADDEQAAQYWFNRKGQGVLTYYFWKLWDAGNFQLTKLNSKLSPFGHHAEINGNWQHFFK